VLYREVGQFKTSYAADMAIFPIRQDRHAFGALLGLVFFVVPLLAIFKIGAFGQDYIFKAILIPFLILALAAIGLNILTGYCGQLSLGAGAFMAGRRLWGLQLRLAPPGAAAAGVDPARRQHGRPRRSPVWHPEPENQRPVRGGGNASRAVLLRLGVPAREVAH
jgi:hypothetical protein